MDRILIAGEADPYDFVFHGDLLVRSRRLEEAVSSYEEAISAYEGVGLYRNAIAIGKKILRSDPHRARTHWRLGDLYAKEGLIGDAVTHFLTFLDHAGGEATGEEFLETLERIAGLCGPKVELALRLSDLYVRAGKTDRAAHMLEEVAGQAAAVGAHEIAQTLRERGASLQEQTKDETPDPAGIAHSIPDGAVGWAQEAVFPSGRAIEPLGRAEVLEEIVDPDADAACGSEVGAAGAGGLSSEQMPHVMGRTIALDASSEAGRAPESLARPSWESEDAPADGPDDPRRSAIEDSIAGEDWDKALALVQELRDEVPNDVWATEKLVVVSRRLGDTLATVRHLTVLGDLLITQEDLEGALACFREVSSLDPENGTARRRLARFREMKVPGAEKIPTDDGFPIRRTIETQGAIVSVREHGGVESQEWIDLAALLDEFRDGIRAQFRPEDYAGHYDLGVSHLEMGLYAESIEEFDLVLSIPSLPEEMNLKAREMRGNALQRLERFREAIHEYRMALEVGGVPPERKTEIRYQLACALERAGELDEARELFLDLSQSSGEVLSAARTHLERLGE